MFEASYKHSPLAQKALDRGHRGLRGRGMMRGGMRESKGKKRGKPRESAAPSRNVPRRGAAVRKVDPVDENKLLTPPLDDQLANVSTFQPY